ncbi:uncharacterized protein GLRG_11364 [Colletotrichum graminicola M1.001]|uniref:Integral membrane protein n=1 Tax=Colletotrichum graminicola (strain M1.001 / M2 / FGSC 10212) TaxID=645133 RepID=E3QZD1_COLGM|nr:uncharacterized protein GLRG_11364 [Colletotrichum graminicola M1.001]EFQ36219.1 hypothetical protein GLRG_11364 [Colletotrichum graminicola M1.001]
MRFTGLTSLLIVALMVAVGMAGKPEQIPNECWGKCSKECIAWVVPFFILFPRFIDCRKQCIIGMYHPECREMLKNVKIGQ